MDWKKVDPELTEAFSSAIDSIDCDNKKMFGCPASFVNGNMFAGVHGEGIFVRFAESETVETADEESN